LGWERFRHSAPAEYQNRKIFFSLIGKNFGRARLKKCEENFSVLLAEAERRRVETLGGIQSVPQYCGIDAITLDFAQRRLEFRPNSTVKFYFFTKS